LADSQLAASESNTTEGTLPAKEPVHVSPLNAVLCLVVLGINAATQRSGADHFANQHLSPARTSPFICLADILVTIIWLVYGVCYKKMSIKASAKMLFKDFDFSEEEDTLGVGNRWSWSIIFVVLFAVGVLLEAIKLFTFAATGTAPWLQTFAAAMFFAAYVVRISVNTISWLCTDSKTIENLKATKADRKMLFNIADLLYNIAYSAQFRFWIATFGNLEYFARPNKKVVPTLLAIYTNWNTEARDLWRKLVSKELGKGRPEQSIPCLIRGYDQCPSRCRMENTFYSLGFACRRCWTLVSCVSHMPDRSQSQETQQCREQDKSKRQYIRGISTGG